jgi:hypothetical protein
MSMPHSSHGFTRDARTAQPSPLTRPMQSVSPERAEEEHLESTFIDEIRVKHHIIEIAEPKVQQQNSKKGEMI